MPVQWLLSAHYQMDLDLVLDKSLSAPGKLDQVFIVLLCLNTAIEEQEMDNRMLKHLEERHFLPFRQPQTATIRSAISRVEHRSPTDQSLDEDLSLRVRESRAAVIDSQFRSLPEQSALDDLSLE